MAVRQRAHTPERLSSRLIEAAGDLREKNQITVPRRIAEAVGLQPGDRLIFVVDEHDGDVVHLHRIRKSYAGVLVGVYGTSEDAADYVRGEQDAWDE